MTHTRRLFDENSHLFDFTATVLSVTPADDGTLRVVLDATAFFPEGGGQAPDTGILGGCPVVDVQEEGGIIHHTVKADLPFPAVGETVEGHLDREARLRKMQNHSGEHIVSGIVHRLYGYTNVGFHLGSGDVTLDCDGVLTRDQLNEIENEANRIGAACLPVKAYYPTPESLKNSGFTDYSVVTLPLGPSCTKLVDTIEAFSFWSLPTYSNFTAEERAAFWMEAKCTWDPEDEEGYYEESREDLIEGFLDRQYINRSDVEFMFEMGETMTATPAINVRWGSLIADDLFGAIIRGDTTPAAVIEELDGEIQSIIDATYNNVSKTE